MGGRRVALDRSTSWIARGLIRSALAMPYPQRVRFVGRAMTHLLGPIAGFNGRIRNNFALAMPELPEADVRRLCRGVIDNMGRTFIENYSHREFFALCADLPLTGPGWAAIEAAKKAERPVVFAISTDRRNTCIETLGGCFVVKRFSRSFVELSGNSIAIMSDQHMREGAPLRFFGLPAATATSAARLAIKYDALLIPAYGVRSTDGLHFDLVFEPPVHMGDPEVMTQALNDSLEAMIRKHPEQWMWTHRRWKLATDGA